MSLILRKKNTRNALKIHLLLLFFTLILSGCSTGNYLYVQEERVDRNFLASTKLGTPDPRQKDPPTGQQLLIAWGFSRGSYHKDLTLVATVRFWNEEQKQFFHHVTRRFGSKAFFFPKKQILTYRVQALSKAGEEVACWEHQLWTEFIQIGEKSKVAEEDQN